jgi:DNA-binding transcriptional MocR family regulator
MLDALERHMPDGATWSRPAGGYFIWLDLPEPIGDLLARAEEAGVTFVKGTDFFADGGGTKSLRLAFSFVSPDEIADGVEKLAGLLRGAPSPASAL